MDEKDSKIPESIDPLGFLNILDATVSWVEEQIKTGTFPEGGEEYQKGGLQACKDLRDQFRDYCQSNDPTNGFFDGQDKNWRKGPGGYFEQWRPMSEDEVTRKKAALMGIDYDEAIQEGVDFLKEKIKAEIENKEKKDNDI